MRSAGNTKRKRGDHNASQESLDGSRPSPHRPDHLGLAHHGSANHGTGPPQAMREGYNRSNRRNNRRGSRGNPRSPTQQFTSGNPRSPPPSNAAASLNLRVSRPSESFNVSPQMQPRSLPDTNNAVETVAVGSIATITASTQTPPPPDLQPDAAYVYEILTDDLQDAWTESGRQNTVDAGHNAKKAQDAVALGLVYQELIRAGLEGKIGASEAGTTIRDILALERSTNDDDNNEDADLDLTDSLDAEALFLDTLSILPDSDVKNARLPRLLHATQIPAARMRELLGIEILVPVGLVRDIFDRKVVRHQTNLLYRQSNYNLLREETEGYSKLVTELFSTSGSEPPSPEAVQDSFRRVKAMIGTFDLDVGRVLDITLDVFAAVLVKHFRFFVKLLRISSWWPASNHLSQHPERPELSTLPRWAWPESHGLKPLSDEQQNETLIARAHRDTVFWPRVREIGIRAFFELGGRRAGEEELRTAAQDDSHEAELDREWIEATGTLPPIGSKDAAQILGFKLRFYASQARDPTDLLPSNLIHLAALLIKIGFLSLRDLFPHLWPADEGMSTLKEKTIKENAEKEKLNRPGGGVANALLSAGALPDDTLPTPAINRLRESETTRTVARAESPSIKAAAEAKPSADTPAPLPEPIEQKVQLLRSLLAIGAIPEALYILGRYPWLPEVFLDLHEYFHRFAHVSLQKVYEPLQPMSGQSAVRDPAQVADPDQSNVPKGSVRRIEQAPRRILKWPQLDRAEEDVDYRYYWDEWSDTIPVCQSVDDVFLFCSTFLNLSALRIGQDPLLLVKLARIGTHSVAVDPSEANFKRWIDLCKRLLVPALSLTKQNSGAVSEVWALIRQFHTDTRYNIYAEWFTGQTSRLPALKSAFERARIETKDVLKRISKTNTRQMARALAKVATASPGIVYTVALNQIESYDNLSEVIVDCGRYFTELGYDVLTWSLMNSLGARGRNRVQADGMLTSRWLSALALFAGNVFKRYSIMTVTPILQYVLQQLQNGNSTDLVVLEQIVSSMTGIVTDATLNDAQVMSMAGGPLLRAQTMLQLLDRRHETSMINSSKRLMRNLLGPRLVGPLLIALAQERQVCIYRLPEEDAHTKLLGNLFDELHRVLTQYLDLLRSNLSVEDFQSLVPPLSALIADYGLEPNIAFWIARPTLAAEVVEHDRAEAAARPPAPVPTVEKSDLPASGSLDTDDSSNAAADSKDVNMESQNVESPGQTVKPEDSDPSKVDEIASEAAPKVEATDGEKIDASSADVKMENSAEVDSTEPSTEEPEISADPPPWHPVIEATMATVKPSLPPEIWEHLSDRFYFAFWQLSLGDLLVPTLSYEDETGRQKRKIQQLAPDREPSSNRLASKEQAKKATEELQDRLHTELRGQIAQYSRTRARLQREKDFWFAEGNSQWDARSVALMEYCFIPRICLSAVDAHYTFTMVKLLHASGAKNFRTVRILDQLFNAKRLTALFFALTTKEAEYFGRFLNELLKWLGAWHANKATYEKEAHGTKKDLPGFRKNPKDAALFDYEDFRIVLLKWHMSLHNALKACFTGGEYMHIRNAIVILRAIVLNFPVINWMGSNQMLIITGLSETDPRDDLKLAAKSLFGSLQRREKDWMLPQAFSLNKAAASNTGSSPAKSTPGRPTSAAAAPNVAPLNAAAPEFVPSNKHNPTEESRPTGTPASKAEFEDGEIKDPGSANVSAPPRTLEDSASAPASKRNNELDGQEQSSKKTGAPDPQPVKPTASRSTRSDQAAQPAKEQPRASTSNVADGNARTSLQDGSPAPQQPARSSEKSKPASVDTSATGNRLESQNGDSREMGPSRSEWHDRERRPEVSRNASSWRDHPPDRLGSQTGRGMAPDRPPLAQRQSDRLVPRMAESRPNDQQPGLGERRGYGERNAPGGPHELTRNDRPGHPHRPQDGRGTTSELPGMRSGDQSMLPPRSLPSDRAGPAPIGRDDERHAPMDRHSEGGRMDRDGHPRSQRGSRAPSPRRDEQSSRSVHSQNSRGSSEQYRQGDADQHAHPRPRYEDPRGPPGHNSHRAEGGPAHGAERYHDDLRGNHNTIPGEQGYYGSRRSRESGDSRYEESQYGRLSQETSNRSRLTNGRALDEGRSDPRGPNPPQQAISGREPNAPRGQETQPPSFGQERNRRDIPENRPPAPAQKSLAPMTPTADATAGVHPDRLRAIQGDSTTRPAPDSRAAVPPAPSSDRPRSDKRFAGLNNVLQQASTSATGDRSASGSTSGRGRASRSNGVPGSPVEAPNNRRDFGPAPPMQGSSAPNRSGGRDYPERGDLFDKRGSSGSYPRAPGDDRPPPRSAPREEDRLPPHRGYDERPQSPRRSSGPASGPSGHDFAREEPSRATRRGGSQYDAEPLHHSPSSNSNSNSNSGSGSGGRELRTRVFGGPSHAMEGGPRDAAHGGRGPSNSGSNAGGDSRNNSLGGWVSERERDRDRDRARESNRERDRDRDRDRERNYRDGPSGGNNNNNININDDSGPGAGGSSGSSSKRRDGWAGERPGPEARQLRERREPLLPQSAAVPSHFESGGSGRKRARGHPPDGDYDHGKRSRRMG